VTVPRRAGSSSAARARYARAVCCAAGVRTPALHRAFARVPRERFLGPAPWLLCDLPGPYRPTPDADPRHVGGSCGSSGTAALERGSAELRGKLILQLPQRTADLPPLVDGVEPHPRSTRVSMRPLCFGGVTARRSVRTASCHGGDRTRIASGNEVAADRRDVAPARVFGAFRSTSYEDAAAAPRQLAATRVYNPDPRAFA
jgi:hypothetical protein